MDELLDKFEMLLFNEQFEEAAKLTENIHPAELAYVMEPLSGRDKRVFFKILPPRLAAEVVVELSDYSREQVLDGLLPQRLAAIVDDMPSDEATDIIAELPHEQAAEVLERIDDEDSTEVRTLLQYGDDTAGGIMQLEMVSAKSYRTVQEVVEKFRSMKEEVETVHNIYVVDENNVLVGMLPMGRLVLAQPGTKIADIMEDCPLTVNASDDQEEVAHSFRRYDVISAPVVNERGQLLGRITGDDVMEVMEEEASEDMARMAGFTGEDEVFYSRNVLKISQLRLPWLLTNLLGGLVTGSLLWMFKVELADALFLLAFIPVIMSTAGNMALQSSTIMVRGFAVGEVAFDKLSSILYKEIRVALVIGAVCGLVVGIAADIWNAHRALGLVVGISMTLSITTAALLGTVTPALFKFLKVDPAISSGPVVATLNDICGLCIYFGIATLFYQYLVA